MNAIISLCKLCNDPARCALCELIRNPRTLNSRTLAKLATSTERHVSILPKAPTPRPSPVAVSANVDTLRAQVEEERQRNEALKRAAGVYGRAVAKVAPIPAPRATPAPVATLRPETATDKVPAFVPAAPAVNLSAPLNVRDWAGLAARVDAGVLSTADAERIGAEWLKGGAPTIKA